MNNLTKLEAELQSSEYGSRPLPKAIIKQLDLSNAFSIILLTVLILISGLLLLGTYIQTKNNTDLINQILIQQDGIKKQLNTIMREQTEFDNKGLLPGSGFYRQKGTEPVSKKQNNQQEIKK